MTGQIWNWLDMSTNKGGTAIIFALCIPYGIQRAFLIHDNRMFAERAFYDLIRRNMHPVNQNRLSIRIKKENILCVRIAVKN